MVLIVVQKYGTYNEEICAKQLIEISVSNLQDPINLAP